MTVRAEIALRRHADPADAQLGETRAASPPFRLAAEAHMNRLGIATGQVPQAERNALERPAPIQYNATVALGVPADLLRNRPDIIAAELRLSAASDGTGRALSEYFPEFSLSALLGLQSQGLSALPSGSAVTATSVMWLALAPACCWQDRR